MLDLHVEPALEPSVEGVYYTQYDVHLQADHSIDVMWIHGNSETIQSTPPLRPSTLAPTYVHVAHTHAARTEQLLQSLRVQHTALRIASSALDLHVLSLADVFEGLSGAAGRELARQEGLLSGLSADLELAARVPVHREFVSPAVRRAMDAGDRGRTLGDYVSRGKMTQVADNCRRTHGELPPDLRAYLG